MRLIDRRTISVLFSGLVFFGVLVLLFAARHTITALIFGTLFAYLLEPAVSAMQRCTRGNRNHAIGAVFLILVISLAIFFLTVGPRAFREAQHLSETLPDMLVNVSSGQIAWTVGEQHGWSYATRAKIGNFLANHQVELIQLKDGLVSHAAEMFSNAIWVLLVPVFSIFILAGKSELSRSVLEWVEASNERRLLRHLLADLDVMLAGFVRAQLMLSILAACAYTIFLIATGLRFALAVGLIAGVLEFVPMVGPLLGIALIVATAFTTGYSHWILLLCFWAIWRLLLDYLIMPHLMGKQLKLHPLLTISAVLIGGELAGVLGMFLSIPAIAAIRVIWDSSMAESHRIRSRPQKPAA